MVRAALTNRAARGAALITAMLVAALAAAVVATLAATQFQWLRTVELRRDEVQAQAIVLAGLAWARDAVREGPGAEAVDHLGEPWALPLPPTPLDNGSVEGSIVDAQSRLNLNNLADDGALARATRERLAPLFERAGLGTAAVDAIAAATGIGVGGGTRATKESRGTTFLRAAEAAAVPGIDGARFAAVAPLVVALPSATRVNVNTAPPEVLALLGSGLDGEALALLVAERTRKPFATPGDFRSRLPQGASVSDETLLGVRSDYFLVTVRARQGEALAQGRALVRRRPNQAPLVVWQTIE
jgi:general secretion pathway protein K